MNNMFDNELKEKLDEYIKQNKLVGKIKTGEIKVEDLTDEEIERMTTYFTTHIEKQKEEIRKLKKTIIEIRKEI